MRGRTPDAPGLQAAKGNPRQRKRKHSVRSAEERAAAIAQALAPGDTFGPPDFMAESTAFDPAIAVWKELSPELKRIGLLERLDRYSFAMYCVHMADWIAATREIAAGGAHYKAKNINGELIERMRPSVKVREIAERHILDHGERFGLNPQTRFKLLRDQSLIGAGPLFGADAPKPPAEGDTTTEDPVGMMARMGGEPPPQLN